VILQNGTNMPLAPQAFGEISPQFYPSYFVPRLGMSLETAFTTYGQLYRTQPWVYTAVNKVASSIARLGVNVWDESPSSGQELDLEGPFAKLMAEPCPTLDPYSFWAWTASTIEIYGETYWIKLRQGRGNQVSGFLPMHPSLVQIFRDQDGTEIYRFMGQPNQELDSSSVVKFRAFHPENYMRGMSRLEPLRLTLLNEDSSRRAMASWWKNGARPSMVLSSERELGTAGRERLKMAFQSEHQGTGNIGRTIVLEDGVTAAPMQYNADEMAYIESRKLDREEVAAVMDLPPTAIQILDHATFSNVTENMRSLYRDSMAPRIEFIESVVNWQVGREFYGPKTMKFAVAEQLRGAFEQRSEAVAKLVQAGIMKPSEARQYFDLNVAGAEADQLYANQALQPLGTPPGGETAGQPALEMGTHVPAIEGPGGNTVPSPAAQKHIRDMTAWLGRGLTLQAAAREVVNKTGDTEGVREACEFLLERRI
jgi:HK97 family phage portal protein